MLGGAADVQPGEVAHAGGRLGGLVVEPDGGAEAARGLAGQRQGVAGGVAEAGGHLAVAGVEPVLGEQVGLGDLALAARQLVQDLPVRHGAARHGLDVAEVPAAETEAEGGVRAQAVARLQDDQAAAGADECGPGAQQLLQGGGERVGADQAFGEFVQGGEVGDPAGEPVLEEDARTGGVGGGRRGTRGVRRGARGRGGRRDSVSGSGNRGVDSGHFREVRGGHGVRLSDRCVLHESIANPHVILRRRQCLHMYTHS